MCIELSDKSTSTRAQKRRRRKSKKKRSKQRARSEQVSELPTPKLPMFAGNVEGLVRAFEDATLAREDWTHSVHLVVALAYAHGHRLEAYTRLREGIQRYNTATGLVETATRGYHETITQAWFHLVLHFLDVFDDGRPLQSLADDLTAVYERNDLFTHYSREQLLSSEARAGWVEPDRAPLPELEPFTPEDRRWMQDHREAAVATSAPAEEARATLVAVA